MYRWWVSALVCVCCLRGACCGQDRSAPAISCLADAAGAWITPRTARTPTIQSIHGHRKAYAIVEARTGGPVGCRNTARLFVADQRSTGFRQVFVQKPSYLGGTADSLGPVSWSPDSRWLLVEREVASYGTDGGGLEILLYDALTGKVIIPDLGELLTKRLCRRCSFLLGSGMRFDNASRIHLQFTDYVADGEDGPETHCFQGAERWILDPKGRTMQLTKAEQ